MLLGEDVIAVAAKAPPAPPHAKDVVVVDPVSDLSDLVAPAPDLLSTTETFTLASALATMCSSTAAEPISYGFSDFLLSFCNGDRKGRNEGSESF